MPLVSIVVPIYKVPKRFLRQCIEGCINQTLKDIEIILVDDGSPDDCGKICDEYAAKDQRIKVIHKENGGLAAARNSGFDAVTGETMMFLDGDDYLELNCCEIAYKKLKEQNAELVMFDQIVDYGNSGVVMHSFKGNPQGLDLEKYQTKNDELKFVGKECQELQLRILNFNGRIAMAFQKLMVTDFLRKHNIRHVDELSQGMEGYVFNVQLFNHVKAAYYIPELLLHYVYNTQSITHKPSERNYHLCVKCLEWMGNYIKQCEQYGRLQAGLRYRALFLIVNTAISCYFSPLYEGAHHERVNKMKSFMNQPLISDAMRYGVRSNLDTQRKIVLLALQYHQWWVLSVLGAMRKKQLDSRTND